MVDAASVLNQVSTCDLGSEGSEGNRSSLLHS